MKYETTDQFIKIAELSPLSHVYNTCCVLINQQSCIQPQWFSIPNCHSLSLTTTSQLQSIYLCLFCNYHSCILCLSLKHTYILWLVAVWCSVCGLDKAPQRVCWLVCSHIMYNNTFMKEVESRDHQLSFCHHNTRVLFSNT